MLLLLALSWLMAGPSSARQVEKPWCYAKEATPYHLLATKTSYFEVDNEDEEPIAVEGKDKFLYEIKLITQMRSTFVLYVQVAPRNPYGSSHATEVAFPEVTPSLKCWRRLLSCKRASCAITSKEGVRKQ